MDDFHERLRARKQELINERAPQREPEINHSELRRIELQYKLDAFVAKVKQIVFIASVIFGLISFFIIRDWWEFIGTKEYSQWKQRTEHVSKN